MIAMKIILRNLAKCVIINAKELMANPIFLYHYQQLLSNVFHEVSSNQDFAAKLHLNKIK
jgi:hypothetical protein